MSRAHGSIILAMLLSHCGGTRERATAAPPPAVAQPPTVMPLVAEAFVGDSCARQRSGQVWCWDRLDGAQLPVGTIVRAPALDGARQIVHGPLFDYVVLLDGRVRRSHRSAGDDATRQRQSSCRTCHQSLTPRLPSTRCTGDELYFVMRSGTVRFWRASDDCECKRGRVA
jgi:hypothetical protein